MELKNVTRKLSAILSADFQSFSRLIGYDQIATIKKITEYQKTIESLVTQVKILPKPIIMNYIILI